MAEFVMPSLGADMTAGTLIGWLKKIGETVNRGDIIAEVDTDKGVIEVEVFQNGTIEKLLVKEGEKVPVGTVLAIINEEAETKPDIEIPTITTAVNSRINASPVARKLADQLGIDLGKIKGTGPNGRIQREDVEVASKAFQVTKPQEPSKKIESDESIRIAGMRRAIAAAMARSKREIPHYYLEANIDFTRALEWIESENAKLPLKDHILYSILLLKAVALALREFPEFNAVWENDRLNLLDTINVGTAISLRKGGLVAPALKETDKKSLPELMGNLRDLVTRTRTGTLRSSEFSDSTITVTNLGEQGVETVFGVIYPPQVALIGFGKIYEDVSVIDGRIRGCKKINATLSADHRASDGHRGALFLRAIEKLLQTPENL